MRKEKNRQSVTLEERKTAKNMSKLDVLKGIVKKTQNNGQQKKGSNK